MRGGDGERLGGTEGGKGGGKGGMNGGGGGAQVIHKVDGAPRGWGDGLRRVLAGTAAVDDCRYQANEEHALGRHGLRHGDPLRSPYFPIIYPRSDPAERADLRSGEVGRSGDLYARLWHTMRWYLEGLILK